MTDTKIADALALAEPAEPVGINGLTDAETSASASVMGFTAPQPPAPAVELTDDDIDRIWRKLNEGDSLKDFARAVKAAHERKKNG
jgi:hypothetical protein